MKRNTTFKDEFSSKNCFVSLVKTNGDTKQLPNCVALFLGVTISHDYTPLLAVHQESKGRQNDMSPIMCYCVFIGALW